MGDKLHIIDQPELSDEWICYLFGSKEGACAFTYVPFKGYHPPLWVRFFCKWCLHCEWRKTKPCGATPSPESEPEEKHYIQEGLES